MYVCRLTDDLRSFIIRGRLQLLQANSLLHIYYNVGKHCRLCNHPSDTVSHVLNGCTKLKDIYQKRHNRIVDIIYSKVRHANGQNPVLKDTMLKPEMFVNENEQVSSSSFQTQNTRLDIVVIDNKTREVIITEISVPFDGHFEKCYNEKFNKYFPLSMEINELGYRTQIVCLIIGSLGHCHHKFQTGLKKNIMNKTEEFLSRYCSTSAMFGSFFAWKKRCRLSPRVDTN